MENLNLSYHGYVENIMVMSYEMYGCSPCDYEFLNIEKFEHNFFISMGCLDAPVDY